MTASTDLENVLAVISRILLWCWILGAALLLLWFLVFLALGNSGFLEDHVKMFGLSKHEFYKVSYYGMAFFKLCVFLLFLIPFIAVRIVLRGVRKQS